MSKLDNYAWRYLPRCRVTHALSHNHAIYARCGTGPEPTSGSCRACVWRGTGNQQEYENAAAYPRCRRCVALIERTT